MIIPDPKMRIGRAAEHNVRRAPSGAGLHGHLIKFAGDVLPSVAATVLGAWIVTHYVNARPETKPVPPLAAAVTQPGETAPKPDAAVAAQAPAAKTDLATPEQPAKSEAVRIIPLRASPTKQTETATRVQEPPKAKHEVVKKVAAAPAERHQTKPDAEANAESKAGSREPVPSALEAASSSDGPSATNNETVAPQDALAIARKALDRIKEDQTASSVKVQDRAASEEAHTPVSQTPASPRTEAAALPSPPPLPPTVILASPSPRSPTEEPPSKRTDPDRPIPPADIPETAPVPPGFVLVR